MIDEQSEKKDNKVAYRMVFILDYIKSHTIVDIPYPDKKFTGQTIIVTGSNTGLGLEAARHFVRLDAEKVILAVRNIERGQAAKESIEKTESRLNVIEVWELDLGSYQSVKAFGTRAQSLSRLDVVVENAGIYVFDFKLIEGNESTITVNVISTFLLGILLIPKMRETAMKFGTVPVLTFVGSFVHYLTTFPERRAGNVFEELRNESIADMNDRYNVSTLIQLLFLRELARALAESPKEGRIIASIVNPGLVETSIMRHATGLMKHFTSSLMTVMARSTEEGARTLVVAGEGGDETHGAYLDDCKPGKVSPWVTSEDGIATQKDIWTELSEELDKIQPGIMLNI